jgi:threonine dehydrogenase-like Zn-dependent dehydrogenase
VITSGREPIAKVALPGSMLAAKKTGPGKAEVIEVAVPQIRPGWVLVRVRACAICASDLPEWRAPIAGPGEPGVWNADNPGLTGHELAGDVVAAGDPKDAGRIGEAVWIDPIAGCGHCEPCREGKHTLCEAVSIVSQGFAEFVVAPARQCRIAPKGFDYATASLIPDMVGTPTGAVKVAGIKPGEAVAVWGLGPVGLGMVQVSLIAGASKVTGIDPVASRRARAERFGAATIDPTSDDTMARLRADTGGKGPDVVLSSVANLQASRQAFDALRPEGRMVTVAGFPPAGGETRKWVSGSWGCDERNWPEILGWLDSRRFRLDGYITHTFPLRRIEEAFAIRAQDLEGSFKVVISDDAGGGTGVSA